MKIKGEQLFMKNKFFRIFNVLISLSIILTISFSSIGVANAATSTSTLLPKDIKGNLAEAQITSLLKKGVVTTYADKTFKPNKNITRIELITIINKLFGLKNTTAINFSDIPNGTPISIEVAKAISAGYINGYSNGVFKPNNPVTRQDCAEIICKLFKLNVTKNAGVLNQIKDLKGVPEASKGYISTVVQNGNFSLYAGNTFKTSKALTRGEACVIISRASGAIYNTSGIFDNANKSVTGNVIVNTSGVSLNNIVINGNLYLTEGIGDGNSILNNVTVMGKTYVCGGGINSIEVQNSTLGETEVNKKNGFVRVAVSGKTKVGNLFANSPCTLEEKSLSGNGFGNVTINLTSPSVVQLVGSFDTLNLNSRMTEVDLSNGSNSSFTSSSNATGAIVKIDSTASLRNMVLNSSASVQGKGSIRTVDIRANGVTVEQTPVYATVKKGITALVSGVQVTDTISFMPSITSAAIDLNTGKMVLTGANLVSVAGINNDINASKLTISSGIFGKSRALTSANNADITSSTSATLTLSEADLTVFKDWFSSSTNKSYNLSAASGWNGTSSPPDYTGNPVTITGDIQPTLTSATLNLTTGQLVLTGSYFTHVTGTGNDILASKLTISDSSGGHSRALSYTPNSEITSTTAATLTISATDLAAIKVWALQNGISVNGYAYNIVAAAGWNGTSSPADLTGNPITISGNPLPTVTSATLNLSTGQFVLTGTNLIAISGSANDITASKFTLSDGSGGHSKTLATTSNIDITNSSTATLTISGTDLTAIAAWATQNGTNINGYAYNISAAAGWNGPDSLADLTGNPITVSGNILPDITSASLNMSNGYLYITGNNLTSIAGVSNDIISSLLTISDGSGGHYRALTYTGNFEITGSTSATIVLSSTDLSYIATWATQNGSSLNGYPYYISAIAGWNGPYSYLDSNNPLTISGNASPTISSATLNVGNGQLVLTGTNLNYITGTSNDVLAPYLTIYDSSGAHSKPLSTTNSVDISSSTSAIIYLSTTDLYDLSLWATQDGTTLNGYYYYLTAAAGWNGPNSAADLANQVTVSHNSPTITSATYDVTTGRLDLTGTNFNSISSGWDIYSTYFTLSDGGSVNTRTFTSSQTANVEITSSTSATITVGGTDLSAIAGWAKQNGTNLNGNAYNLSAAAGWNVTNTLADPITPVTVSGNTSPTITSATYNVTTGQLDLTGINFNSISTADILSSHFTLSDGGTVNTKTFSDPLTVNVEINSSTSATIMVKGADLTAIAGWAKQNGISLNGNAYNLAATAVWNGPNSSADLSTPVTISGSTSPVITSATYDVTNKQLVLTGTNFSSFAGPTNDILITHITISDGVGGHTFPLTNPTTANAEITSSTSATITIAGTDLNGVLWITQNGASLNGNAYNIAVSAGWNGTDSLADATSPITVSGNTSPTMASAVRTSNTLITVTLSKVASVPTITKVNDGGFTVSDASNVSTTFAVTRIDPGTTNDKVVLTVADTSGVVNLLVKYTAAGNGTVADAGGNPMATNASGVAVTNGSVPSPALVTVPTLAPGTSAGQTIVTLAALPAGHSYKYFVSTDSNAVPTPSVGTNETAWTTVVNGGVINAANGKHIGFAEVDAGGLVIRFNDVIAVSAVTASPLAHGVIFADVTGIGNDGKTQITLGAPSAGGDTFKYIKSVDANAVPTPIVGYNASAWTTVVTTDVILATNNQHIGIAEVDGSGHVVCFSDYTAVALNYLPPTAAMKVAASTPVNPVNLNTLISGGATLTLNTQVVALSNLASLGDSYDATTNVNEVAAKLQLDINAVFTGSGGSATYTVTVVGGVLVITSSQTGATSTVNLSGSTAAIATALGFTTAPVIGTDAQN